MKLLVKRQGYFSLQMHVWYCIEIKTHDEIQINERGIVRTTLSVIKADIGSIGGHIKSSHQLLARTGK